MKAAVAQAKKSQPGKQVYDFAAGGTAHVVVGQANRRCLLSVQHELRAITMRHALLLVGLVAITLMPVGRRPRRAASAGAAHRAHGSGHVSAVAGGARRRRDDVVHRAAQSRCGHARVQLPAPRCDSRRRRHRPSLPQRGRGDVRDPRRRSAVHDRRPHRDREGTSRRALPHRATRTPSTIPGPRRCSG